MLHRFALAGLLARVSALMLMSDVMRINELRRVNPTASRALTLSG